MRLMVAPRKEISILCSDGVRTGRTRLVAP
jgi:hypothetical protein